MSPNFASEACAIAWVKASLGQNSRSQGCACTVFTVCLVRAIRDRSDEGDRMTLRLSDKDASSPALKYQDGSPPTGFRAIALAQLGERRPCTDNPCDDRPPSRKRRTDHQFGVCNPSYNPHGAMAGISRFGRPVSRRRPPRPGRDRIAVMAGQERYALIGAVAIGVVLFVAAVFAIRAGGGWAALGWVLMVIVILGAIGAAGSRFTRR